MGEAIKKNEPMFNPKNLLEIIFFDLHLVRLECDDSWVRGCSDECY